MQTLIKGIALLATLVAMHANTGCKAAAESVVVVPCETDSECELLNPEITEMDGAQ